MQIRWLLGAALASSAVGFVACDSDTSGPGPLSDDGGNDATADDASPGSDGGTGAGDGASPGEGGSDAGSDGASGDAHPDSGASDGGDAGDAGPPAYALFVGTDYVNAELSVVALNPDSVAGRLSLDDQDSIPAASNALGFVLERAIGKVISLDPTRPWTARSTIDINDGPDAASYAADPHAIVVAAGDKAYVARYASNTLKVVDVASGAVTGSVDLSAFVAADDTDGLVDVTDAVYDGASNRVYFLLQRINQFDYSGSAPDYVNACLASHGEIVAVNAATDAVVSLSDASATGAIDLLGDNPAALTADLANGRILVTETGCYQNPDGGPDAGDVLRMGRGIEAVSLSAATPAWLYQTTDVQRLSGIIWVDGTHAYVNAGADWYAWDPTQTTLGAAVTGFPQAPFYDGNGRIVGLSVVEPDAGSDAGNAWSVVAWSIADGQVTPIAQAPFQSVSPATAYGVTSALLR